MLDSAFPADREPSQVRGDLSSRLGTPPALARLGIIVLAVTVAVELLGDLGLIEHKRAVAGRRVGLLCYRPRDASWQSLTETVRRMMPQDVPF